jgi:hypothetical protein
MNRAATSWRQARRGLYLATVGLVIGAAPSAGAEINDVSWLSGCWASDGGEPGSGEQWTSPAGGSMFAVSRTVRNNKTVAFEFLRIIETENGGLLYIALPSGQTLTTFVMISLSADEVVFENPDHDFPQRVAYQRPSADRLVGRIEGAINGGRRRIEFPMTAVDCASGAAEK